LARPTAANTRIDAASATIAIGQALRRLFQVTLGVFHAVWIARRAHGWATCPAGDPNVPIDRRSLMDKGFLASPAVSAGV